MSTADRLERWANARERRNPTGNGSKGTALLRAAAAELRAVDEFEAELHAAAVDVRNTDRLRQIVLDGCRTRLREMREKARRS